MATYLPVPEIFASPSVRAHEPGAEMHAVRDRAALVRSLLDELDLLAPPSTPTPVLPATVAFEALEELKHLALRMMQAAAEIAPHRVGELYLNRGSVPPPSGDATGE
jgi:hypothetical protein